MLSNLLSSIAERIISNLKLCFSTPWVTIWIVRKGRMGINNQGLLEKHKIRNFLFFFIRWISIFSYEKVTVTDKKWHTVTAFVINILYNRTLMACRFSGRFFSDTLLRYKRKRKPARNVLPSFHIVPLKGSHWFHIVPLKRSHYFSIVPFKSSSIFTLLLLKGPAILTVSLLNGSSIFFLSF